MIKQVGTTFRSVKNMIIESTFDDALTELVSYAQSIPRVTESNVLKCVNVIQDFEDQPGSEYQPVLDSCFDSLFVSAENYVNRLEQAMVSACFDHPGPKNPPKSLRERLGVKRQLIKRINQLMIDDDYAVPEIKAVLNFVRDLKKKEL